MASNDCFENSSEEIRENCSVCTEGNKDVRAEKYCVECKDYYCSSCVTIHTTIPALRSHKVLDQDAGPDGKLPLCQDVFRIPDLTKARTEDLTGFLQCFTDIEEKIQKFQERFLGWRDSLRKSKEQEMEKISDFKANLAKKIKEGEQRAFQMVEKCFEGLDKDLQTNIESVSKELVSIEQTKRLIKSSSKNSSQAFVVMKMNQENLKKAEKAYETVSKVKINHGITFAPNCAFETIMIDQFCLGNVTEESFISEFLLRCNTVIKSGSVSQSRPRMTMPQSSMPCRPQQPQAPRMPKKTRPGYCQYQNNRPQPLSQAIVVAGQDALTASMLAAAPHHEQKQMLGERLFPLIQRMYPDLAGKITGMVLEMENLELLHMLESTESLKAKVEEAVAVLQAHQAKEAAATQTATKAKKNKKYNHCNRHIF